MADPRAAHKGPPAADRPARLVGLFSARPLALTEIPRLIEVCSQAYAEETPGASLRLLPGEPGASIFRIEAIPGAMLKESEIVLRVHSIDDPASDHPALVAHFARLDEEIGGLAGQAIEGARSYLALIGTRLLERGRISAFLNTGALIGSAMGAAFLDPSAVMVTQDPGEWAEACEQSLSIEGAMAAGRTPIPE
jgi:hypothetical protein